MATQSLTLAVIVKNASIDGQFILVKQRRPPKFEDEEYDSYVDSDLWDLPFTRLDLLSGESRSQSVLKGAELCSENIDFEKFDLDSALAEVLGQVQLEASQCGEWSFWKYLEEAEFGPGSPNHTVFVVGKVFARDPTLRESCKWMSAGSCLSWLQNVTPNTDRVGPLVVLGLLNDSLKSEETQLSPSIRYQEYPPGIILVPFQSCTQRPFYTTNLVVFAPEKDSHEQRKCDFIVSGDALIVDPGCRSDFHRELKKVVEALPRKLVVFVTHHHRDHVDGLSVIQKCNPDATLVAHENTMRRIGKDDWSLGCTTVCGNEDISIKGQRLRVLFAPGHTDGHMALLDSGTNSLIVGDHCVGQGSAILDITSGGNMTAYFQSTYKFMELSPHVLIPMHGRVNLWPKHMLCGYLKNRRSREASVLQAIENGAETLFDIVASVYAEVDRRFWIPAASNVRLHVDHLAEQDKLPKDFSFDKFYGSLDSFADMVGKL